jgi:uncharacterized protein
VNTKQDIDGFLGQKVLAIAGASRDPRSFSAAAVRELTAKGYTVIPVNPNAESIGGLQCYPSLAKLPQKAGGVVVFTPPDQTEKIVREAVAAGITRIWIQQGAQSEEALAFCREKELPAVTRQCILMHAEPVGSIHGVHRWVKKLFGGMPK